jgi:sulfate adenylyltransferase subunit 2
VQRAGTFIMLDDARFPLEPGESPVMRKMRSRTLGCYPLTGAIESSAATSADIVREMLAIHTSERRGRLIDSDEMAPMEKKRREGYF